MAATRFRSTDIQLSCSNFSEGLNTAEKTVDVGYAYLTAVGIRKASRVTEGQLQCVDCLNVMLHNNKRRPTVKAINYAVAGRIRGLGTYRRYDGTDTLLVTVANILYSVNKTTGALTQIYNFGTAGETYFLTWLDKAWVLVSGVGLYKVEGGTGYPVGIAAPSGCTAKAAAGGSLAAGVYKIYVGYARKVGGSNVLYSSGEALANITLGGGNGSIAFTIPNSSDPQVNNKVVWMTDADGATYYYYGETGDNMTTTLTISSTASKSTALIYNVQAALNLVPGAYTHFCMHARRLWGCLDNTVYYSLQEGNVYDYERWDTQTNYIVFPAKVYGVFSLGSDLIISTAAGMIVQPDGDPTAAYVLHEGHYFKYPNTVCEYKGMLIGLTDDGVRVFDGQTMSEELSRDVKPEMDTLYTGYTTNNIPAAVVFRREDRSEYHLVYHDATVSRGQNNRRLVLNLDRLVMGENNVWSRAPWEKWSNAANYMTVDANELMYCAQAHDDASVIYKDRTDRCRDENIYLSDTLTAASVPETKIRSGTFVFDLRGTVFWEQVRVLAQLLANMTVKIKIVDAASAATSNTITPVLAGFQLNVDRLGVDRLAPEIPTLRKTGIPRNVRGAAAYIEIGQTAEDQSWQLLELVMYGRLTRSRLL
jgi:hypothetical protein